jgi:hypothetical protein
MEKMQKETQLKSLPQNGISRLRAMGEVTANRLHEVVAISLAEKHEPLDLSLKDELITGKKRRGPHGSLEILQFCAEMEEECSCCDRAGEYNGFASGLLLFICPVSCSCHD